MMTGVADATEETRMNERGDELALVTRVDRLMSLVLAVPASAEDAASCPGRARAASGATSRNRFRSPRAESPATSRHEFADCGPALAA